MRRGAADTRGTHIAPESTNIDRAVASPSFATPAGLTAPLFLKWLLVFEDPISRTLWLGRAVPRAWLAQGQRVGADGVPTAYGRLSFALCSSIDASTDVQANVSLPASLLTAPPSGGFTLRLRVPGKLELQSATVGGQPWAAINATDATIHFAASALREVGMGTRMQSIVGTFSASAGGALAPSSRPACL